eukprot:CAMPEP_0170381498 /NCGR_PEP_ID=MMETSP0117_2-20130122/14444_1 /TAXON_ID=400756 /ORGANISM="Durinskia baltica, Strain CSIRO CS-38" /LENGTH=654 /DNA_ID=CAMNT_0010637079 /DNA_START=66 /DNA_END=2030 /DNA_ORIENTATION=-
MAHPLQIIVTGDSEKDYFVLRQENLASIIAKIPDDAKVSIVSVVGAFRTGKSFLLNFFLRYLRTEHGGDGTSSWMVAEGDELTEGNMNEGGWNLVEPEHATSPTAASTKTDGSSGEDSTMKEVMSTSTGRQTLKKEASFAWRGGQERQTTGIWMWSEPFIRTTSASGGEKLAVLLMDTQGMFDNETTMTLTAQIFGLSTLVSSFQIYNVDKRIQEDNLQHLALFSEYGRMALSSKDSTPPPQPQDPMENLPAPPSDASVDAAPVMPPLPPTAAEAALGASETTEAAKKGEKSKKEEEKEEVKPFQRLQFLVRDWQNFDGDYEEGQDISAFKALHDEMQKYLSDVLKTRGLGDLQSTREQITRCFEKLDCYMLPHPGFSVTKKNYDGSISKIDPFFRALVNQYVRILFDTELEAKVINGRKLSGRELQTYFEVYVKMFQAGQKSFPKAMTMLDATAEANNRNAYDLALSYYKTKMEVAAGADKPYIKEVDLQKVHDALYIAAFEQFDEIATMGAKNVIIKMRDQLKEAIEGERERYFSTNALRNPFRDVELYILPMGVAVVSWLCAVLVNASCSTDFCEATEDTFVNVYLFVFFCIIVLAWRHIRGAIIYAKDILLPMAMAGANANSSSGGSGAASDVAAGILGSISDKTKQKTN